METLNETNSLDAGEYVLGTLGVDEREAFERRLETDGDLQAAVRFWEARLAGLDGAMGEVEPGAGVWKRIESSLPAYAAAGHGAPVAANDNELRKMRSARNGWRFATLVAAGLALALGAVLANPQVGRNLGIGEQPAEQIVGLDARSYVAVVNRDGSLPAFIVNVDAATGDVSVRSLEVEAVAQDKSLELWWIPEGETAISVGLLDEGSAIADIDPMEEGVFAVTLEAKGGTPTGVAQGPVVYSGKLVPAE